jgi:hypothetical protein
LSIAEEEYVQSFKVELMDAVVQWCRGASFAEICKASSPAKNAHPLPPGPWLTLGIPCSSRTSSKATLFAFSGGCKSSFDKWPRLQRSSATLNFSKNSKKHPRCSGGPTLSFLPRHCTSKSTIYSGYPYHFPIDSNTTYIMADTQKIRGKEREWVSKKTGETEEIQDPIHQDPAILSLA